MASDRPALHREAIVQAARDLVIADGLDALSLRRLATRLEVTAPALYAHVRDKLDLLRTLAAGEFERLAARFESVDDPDPLERIRAHGRAYARHAREQPELFRVMFLFPPALPASDVPDGAPLPAATATFALAAEAVEAAIAAGQIEAEDPLLVVLTLWSGVHGVATVLQLGFGLPEALEDALVDEITDRLLAGYRPTTG